MMCCIEGVTSGEGVDEGVDERVDEGVKRRGKMKGSKGLKVGVNRWV